MQIVRKGHHLSIYDGTGAEVTNLFKRLHRMGATPVQSPTWDVDDQNWFADMDLPVDDQRIIYTCILAVARSLECAIHLDTYTRANTTIRRQYLRFKGPEAHTPNLVILVRALVGLNRVRIYTNRPNEGWQEPGRVEPALSITLTGLHIVKERRIK